MSARTTACCFAGWVLCTFNAGAQSESPEPGPAAPKEVRRALPADPLYDEGTHALDEGLPQVAVYKLRAFLATRPAPAARRATVLALGRALLALPDAPAALNLLDGEGPAAAADAEAVFWHAQVQATLEHWTDALADYTRAAEGTAPAELLTRARFGRGESLFALGRIGEAATVYKLLFPFPEVAERARLRYAEIELDRWHAKPDSSHLKEAASALLDPQVSAGSSRFITQQHAYLLGRLRLAQRQPALAEQLFRQSLSRPEGLSERLLVDNYWGWARACLDEDQPDRAQDALENLVDRHPRNSFLAQTLTWLEILYRRGATPDLSGLRRWADDATELDRQAAARLALARIEVHAGRSDVAEELLSGFEDRFPASPLRLRALLELAALRLQLGRPDAAHEILDHARQLAAADPGEPGGSARTAWRTEIEALDARISLAQHDNVHAAERFEALAARLGTGPQAEAAAFNAVLGWLRAGDQGRFAETEGAFNAHFPRSAYAAEFTLEEGLARADQSTPGDTAGRQRAADCLRAFLAEYPGHPRAPEAHLALAELAFAGPAPEIDAARQELDAPGLRRVSNDTGTSPTPSSPIAAAASDRADYLAIWLADAPGPARDTDKAVTLAKKFLAERPDSPLVAEVRMKLGEIYFQRADYPDAQTQLELLAKNAPDSPLAEPALYLAGMSARLSMNAAGLDDAVDLFEQAARRGGPFKLPARLQQAEVQNQLDRGRDAIILYDGILAATNGKTLTDADLDSRCAALCGRGKTLLAMAGTSGTDQAGLREAVGAFDQLATGTPGASLLWRRQALTLKGHALEKLGDTDAALAAYDDALNAADPPSGSEPNAYEWTWFYRAGSDAARLLEAHEQWGPAIAIYRKLAAADGLMKSEFENLLKRRQLEHFIWEE